MGTMISAGIILESVVCCSCGITFAMPEHMLNKRRNTPDIEFFCPNGHSLVFRKSKEKELRELAEQRMREAQNALANKDAQLIQLEDQLKKQQNKLNRVQKGVCPCCNRSFQDLARHMESKHPELKEKKKK